MFAIPTEEFALFKKYDHKLSFLFIKNLKELTEVVLLFISRFIPH